MIRKQKIVVAMSGGVDSSTVAAMLKNEGHEVIGITLQLYDHGVALQKKGACCAGVDIYDAQMVAEKINIPHYVLNYESIFKQRVIDDFAESYLRGETPIPCVRCNQKVKFNDLFNVAKNLDADALATGHYVRKISGADNAQMHKGIDGAKDQSYFLFTTTQEQLNYLMFPIGGMYKSETRALAKKFGLDIAEKPDSQDICFVPSGGYGDLIQRMRPDAFIPGDILFKDGTIIGTHKGIFHYTVGQRKGMNIGGYSEPLYVLEIKPEKRQIWVGFRSDLRSPEFFIKDLNWLYEGSIPDEGIECVVKIRSGHLGSPARVYREYDGKNRVVLLCDDYIAIAPGQACVMYNDSRLLGGGWIMSRDNFR